MWCATVLTVNVQRTQTNIMKSCIGDENQNMHWPNCISLIVVVCVKVSDMHSGIFQQRPSITHVRTPSPIKHADSICCVHWGVVWRPPGDHSASEPRACRGQMAPSAGKIWFSPGCKPQVEKIKPYSCFSKSRK